MTRRFVGLFFGLLGAALLAGLVLAIGPDRLQGYANQLVGRDTPTVVAASRARDLLHRYVPDEHALTRGGTLELAKRLNYFVYQHCRNEQPHITNLIDLFNDCKTACGGFAYVFRELLDVFDVKTRLVNIYNIPGQGNHSLVEVEYGRGKWALFDPTFGAFFTTDGAVQGTPLSMDQLQYAYFGKDLIGHVLSAKRGAPGAATRGLESLYAAGSFERPYMSLRYYHAAEVYGPVDGGRKITLRLRAPVSNGSFVFGSSAADPADAEREFLKITNDTLNDDIEGNEVSFVFSYLGHNGLQEHRNLLDISGLIPGSTYRLQLSGHNRFGEFKFVPSIIDGKALLQSSDPIVVAPGRFEVALNFHVFSERILLLLERHRPEDRLVRLYRVAIEKAEGQD